MSRRLHKRIRRLKARIAELEEIELSFNRIHEEVRAPRQLFLRGDYLLRLESTVHAEVRRTEVRRAYAQGR